MRFRIDRIKLLSLSIRPLESRTDLIKGHFETIIARIDDVDFPSN